MLHSDTLSWFWTMLHSDTLSWFWTMLQRVEQKMSASETVNIVQSGLRKQFYMSNLFLRKIRWFIYQGFLDILWLSAIIKLTKLVFLLTNAIINIFQIFPNKLFQWNLCFLFNFQDYHILTITLKKCMMKKMGLNNINYITKMLKKSRLDRRYAKK
jgi:hypothetical protein